MSEIQLLQWILGVIGAVATALFGIWWKIESRQDQKIDDLGKANEEAHRRLHDKVDDTRKQLVGQHNQLRDKLEDIWKFLYEDRREAEAIRENGSKADRQGP